MTRLRKLSGGDRNRRGRKREGMKSMLDGGKWLNYGRKDTYIG